MPYDTGAVTNFESLHGIIDTFLTSNGWTQDGDVLYKGNVFVRLASLDSSYLRVYGGTAQAAGVLTNETPSYAQMRWNVIKGAGQHSTSAMTEMNQYYMFVHTNPDFFCVVLKYDLIWTQFLTWGELDKYATFTGGQYINGSYAASVAGNTYYEFYNGFARTNNRNSSYTPLGIGYWYGGWDDGSPDNNYATLFIRCELEGQTWMGNSGTHSALQQNYQVCGANLVADLTFNNPNNWNEQSILVPVIANMTMPESKISILGNPVYGRLTNVKNYNIADIITLGNEKWMVFPHMKKTTGNPTETSHIEGASGRQGFAIKYDGA